MGQKRKANEYSEIQERVLERDFKRMVLDSQFGEEDLEDILLRAKERAGKGTFCLYFSGELGRFFDCSASLTQLEDFGFIVTSIGIFWHKPTIQNSLAAAWRDEAVRWTQQSGGDVPMEIGSR